jgi:hypothetical protein
MVKTRAWYALSMEERRRTMTEHVRVGHKYPKIRINTSYSYGLDDQEFVVAFEGDDPAEFLDLVSDLRYTEASSYTLRDTPMFTCVLRTPAELVREFSSGVLSAGAEQIARLPVADDRGRPPTRSASIGAASPHAADEMLPAFGMIKRAAQIAEE